MKARHIARRICPNALWLLAGCWLWAWISWPLPARFAEAIPYVSQPRAETAMRPLVPGPHLQPLYRFWRVQDALSGQSPVFLDRYHVSLANRAGQPDLHLFHLPFSLVYAAVAPRWGYAAGGNAAGLASILLGIWALGALSRRFASSPSASWAATFLAATFPPVWIALFAGDSAGYTMAFAPLLFLGLDRAIRGESFRGGGLATLALFLSLSTDARVFHTLVLAMPFWILFVIVLLSRNSSSGRIRFRRRAATLIPVLVMAGAGMAISPWLEGSGSNVAGRFIVVVTLIPSIMAVILSWIFGFWFDSRRPQRVRHISKGAAIALVIASLLHAASRHAPGLCRLPQSNVAYATAAADHKAHAGRHPLAVAVPICSHPSPWRHVHQYAIMQSGIRLLHGGGYDRPDRQAEEFFVRFGSLNQGVLTEEQLDDLFEHGVRHLLLHTQALDADSSPFPPAATLRKWTGHPRLSLIADDGLTFAYRILPRRPFPHVPHYNWAEALHGTTLHWHWDPPLHIPRGGQAPLRLARPVHLAPGMRYLLQLAEGSTHPLLIPPGREGLSSLTHPIPEHPDWLQAEWTSPGGAKLLAVAGPVAIKRAMLLAGDLPTRDPNGHIRILPALLDHTGHSSPGDPSVRFEIKTVPPGVVLAGPNLPLPPGVYDITLRYTPSARGGPSPGMFQILTHPEGILLAQAPLDPESEILTFPAIRLHSDPIRFEFVYPGVSRIVLHEIRLSPSTLRLQPQAQPTPSMPEN